MARFQKLPMPERPRDVPEAEIERLYRFLWQMAEIMNTNIDQLEKEAKDDGST